MSNGIHPIGEDRTLRILFLEANPNDVQLCLKRLHEEGFVIKAEVAATPQEFCEKVCNSFFDLILADCELPAWTGLKALELLQHLGKSIPFILVTRIYAEAIALEFVKQGADDFVLKDRLGRLPLAIDRVLRERRLLEDRKLDALEREQLIAQLRDALSEVKRLSGLLPVCVACQRMRSADGQWQRIELYARKRPSGRLEAMLCPDCIRNQEPGYLNWEQSSAEPADPDSDQAGGLRV